MLTERSLKIFKNASTIVPAYKFFLDKNNIIPDEIRTSEDLKSVPITSKKNYLIHSERMDLMDHDLSDQLLWYCSTSGSTGEPYYFPRDDSVAARGADFLGDFLEYSPYGNKKTLVILAFGMGVWIGGIITMRSFEIAAIKLKFPLSIIPTGYNKEQVFKALHQLAPEFGQVILVGYPPFVKEIIDEAETAGIDLSKLRLRIVFAAEAFTETFRNYLTQKAGITNPLLNTLNIYGSADIGAMAYETPVSILVRQLALRDPLLFRNIFGQIEKTPTLAQYEPKFIEFESEEGELLLTSNSVIPLIRYAIGDHGGVLEYKLIERILKKYNINLKNEIKKHNIQHTVKPLPFVFVYERSDLSASLHGIIIYPEFIKEGLLSSTLSPYFTERFTMMTSNDIHHNQFLKINVELKIGVEISKDLENVAKRIILEHLIAKSSEFSEISKSKHSTKLIEVELWRNGEPRYFAPGVKQNWVEK